MYTNYSNVKIIESIDTNVNELPSQIENMDRGVAFELNSIVEDLKVLKTEIPSSNRLLEDVITRVDIVTKSMQISQSKVDNFIKEKLMNEIKKEYDYNLNGRVATEFHGFSRG